MKQCAIDPVRCFSYHLIVEIRLHESPVLPENVTQHRVFLSDSTFQWFSPTAILKVEADGRR
jgi:hypothetical protein